MKTSRQLDLIVRKAAASELFPGESSGYNSSASSVTEDQSPSWSDSKRLSIVKEENTGLEERINKRSEYQPISRFRFRGIYNRIVNGVISNYVVKVSPLTTNIENI